MARNANQKPDEHVSVAMARSADWLARANEANERGAKLTAERCYRKAQIWLDRHNELTGEA